MAVHLPLVFFMLAAAPGALAPAGPNEPWKALFDFETGLDRSLLETRDARAELVSVPGGHALRVELGHSIDWPGITLKAPGGHWDLSAYARVSVKLKNVGQHAARFGLRVDNPGADGARNCVQVTARLEPGHSTVLTARFYPGLICFTKPVEFIGMQSVPGGPLRMDPRNVVVVRVFANRPAADTVLLLDEIRAEGRLEPVDPAGFFPFIDTFGQFIHADWPGKTHSVEELRAAIAEEQADLAAHPGPTDWDKYGGWAAGPKLEATGGFRVEKYEGKWWLVDPEGHLFWSHGIDCVHAGVVTPITGRRSYFADLPVQDSPLARFYGRRSSALAGYYRDHKPFEVFDFGAANRYRKYGPDYERIFAGLCHRRLRSWGMNTIGNWSDRKICEMDRTPYAMNLWFRAPAIEGSRGFWKKFPDPFDPRFRQGIRGAFEKWQSNTARDPWCIGYFVDNELSWGDDTALARAVLASSPEQAAKRAFVQRLKARYATVDGLNAAWGSSYASWDALLRSRTSPTTVMAEKDLKAFTAEIAETYFRTCREEIKRAAPQRLYLGCRFAKHRYNEAALRAAARYCDIVSFNLYQRSVADFHLPGGLDAPVIVGEFHFGALDRGMFHVGLVPVTDQQARARAYVAYVRSALRNPLVVGTHWFQYTSQATTGRINRGENNQIGFVDICDRPYPETIRACRRVGYGLYQCRFGATTGGKP